MAPAIVVEGPAVVIGPRVALLLEKHADLGRFRLAVRGQDPELDAALSALHAVASRFEPDLVSDVVSDVGHDDDSTPETGASSPLMTTTEVADHAGCNPRTVRYAAEAGRLVGKSVTAGWLFDPDAVRTWMAERAGAAA